MDADLNTDIETLLGSPHASIRRVVTAPLDNNVYFLRCEKTGKAVMFDAPGGNPSLLVDLCRSMSVEDVFITHGHWDHVGAVRTLRSRGLRVHIGEGDSENATHDGLIRAGDVHRVGEITLQVRHTPGHSPGSMCFLATSEGVVFSGDTLFPGGPGATNKPGSDFDTIMSSLTELFDDLDDTTIVFPGHGDSTTIGKERPHLDEWRQRGW